MSCNSMKPLTLIIILCSTAFSCFSQTTRDRERTRLVDYIKACDRVETYCLGEGCNSYSELYQKADSLFAISDLNDVQTYFNDSSYSLKYYTFFYVLRISDSIAFNYLEKNILDDRRI